MVNRFNKQIKGNEINLMNKLYRDNMPWPDMKLSMTFGADLRDLAVTDGALKKMGLCNHWQRRPGSY